MSHDVGGSFQDRRVVVDRRQQVRRRNSVPSSTVAGGRSSRPFERRFTRTVGPQRTLALTRFVSARDVQELHDKHGVEDVGRYIEINAGEWRKLTFEEREAIREIGGPA